MKGAAAKSNVDDVISCPDARTLRSFDDRPASWGERVFAWCCRLSPAAFCTVLGLLTVLRCGYRRYATIQQQLEFARQFPVPTDSYKATSVVGPTLAYITHATSKANWWRLHLAASLLAVLVTAILTIRLLRGSEQRRALAVLLCSSAAPVALAQLIGHYDVFTLLGGILFGLSAGLPMAICSGVFTGFANAEQGI